MRSPGVRGLVRHRLGRPSGGLFHRPHFITHFWSPDDDIRHQGCPALMKPYFELADDRSSSADFEAITRLRRAAQSKIEDHKT